MGSILSVGTGVLKIETSLGRSGIVKVLQRRSGGCEGGLRRKRSLEWTMVEADDVGDVGISFGPLSGSVFPSTLPKYPSPSGSMDKEAVPSFP
jgi:hypothetical protein